MNKESSMNDFGWKNWKELPYRGDGKSRNVKPRRRFVNLKKERRQTIITVLIIIILSTLIFGFILLSPDPKTNDTAKIGGVVIGSILVLTLVGGILSISKFRKGYDVDTSAESRVPRRKRAAKHKNTIN
jgi:hypothetical protein